MAVKLDIFANVKGSKQVDSLNRGVNKLGKEATVAATRMKNLEVAAARSRATFAALGTTLKVGVGVGLAAVTVGIGKFVKDTFDAGKLTESLQVRFKLLFNSVEEGGRAFEVMNKFASKVPFSLEAIAAGSGNLAVISKDANELSKILEITGNVAAATGLDFRQTAEQIQRSFAGGIASADVFRERGVRAMLGFEAGAKVSIEETRKRFFEVFANGGQFSKATGDFEQTLEAQVSFVQDAYFRFRQAAAKPLFDGVTRQLKELVGNFKENDEQLKILAKRVGEGLATGFRKLGEFIKFIVVNFDELIKVVKIFISLKIIGFVGNLTSQLLLMAKGIKAASVSFAALNIAMRANPIGILVTAIQGATIAWIAFGDEIRSIGSYISDKFNGIIDKAALNIRKFTQAIGFGSDENLEKIKDLEKAVNGVAASYRNLSKEQKAAFAGQLKDPSARATKFKNLKTPNTRGDMRNAENEKQEAYLKRMADLQAKSWRENRINIVDNAKARGEAERKALENIKLYREQLSNVGIDAKGIADSISTTWVNGLREGNSLLEITKNSFKNVLQTIAETMLQKSIEYGVEQIFQALLGNRVSIEKEVTKEKTKQLAIQAAITAMGGGGGGGPGASFSRAFGMAEGGIVPGGAPYTDRVPTMLTPGELVVPRKNFNDVAKGNSSNITNINISGNVDQRSIEQIQAVIAQSSAQVGGANRTYQSNTRGVRGRNR
jgi:hypothetical protein